MTIQQKQQVKDALLRYASGFDTQAAAAATLNGVSAATLSLVKNDNWELVSDRIWQLLARQVGFYQGEWHAADTGAYMLLHILCGDAQQYGMWYGVAVGTGMGKTYAAMQYARQHDNVLYLHGHEGHNRRTFLQQLALQLGESPAGAAPTLAARIAACMAHKNAPLLIVDDAHRLRDRVLHTAVMLAAGMAGAAGTIIMGDDALRTRITEGRGMDKAGYEEIYKAIGRRFISLGKTGPGDMALVCRANGITDPEAISYIEREAGGNMHTITRLVQAQAQHGMAA